MTNKEYGRAFVDAIESTANEAGGTTITIKNSFESPKVDFSNEQNVKVMATYAIKTADGLYSLVHEKCNTERPLSNENTNIAMYISLGALASEIYLKALLYYQNRHNGARINKHKLDVLLKMLSFDEYTRIAKQVPELDERISSVSDAFVELRYVFEINAFSKEYLLIFDLMNVLHDICAELKPYKTAVLEYGSGIVRIESFGGDNS